MEHCERRAAGKGAAAAEQGRRQPQCLGRAPEHFTCDKAQPFPAPYERLRQSLKYLKKSRELWPLLLDHNACGFRVQVDLSRCFLPFH